MTGALIVSKAGGTAETLSQAHALLPKLADAAAQAIALTEPTYTSATRTRLLTLSANVSGIWT